MSFQAVLNQGMNWVELVPQNSTFPERIEGKKRIDGTSRISKKGDNFRTWVLKFECETYGSAFIVLIACLVTEESSLAEKPCKSGD